MSDRVSLTSETARRGNRERGRIRLALEVAGLGLWLSLVMAACGDDNADPAATPTAARGLITARLTVESDGRSATISVEIAATRREREQGLMFRQQLAEDAGMLFLFPSDDSIGFWMRNTYVPLTIAYVDASGRVLELRDGRPLDESILRPSQPYRFVLEVNQGWFERHGFGPGARIRLPENLPAAE